MTKLLFGTRAAAIGGPARDTLDDRITVGLLVRLFAFVAPAIIARLCQAATTGYERILLRAQLRNLEIFFEPSG